MKDSASYSGLIPVELLCNVIHVCLLVLKRLDPTSEGPYGVLNGTSLTSIAVVEAKSFL